MWIWEKGAQGVGFLHPHLGAQSHEPRVCVLLFTGVVLCLLDEEELVGIQDISSAQSISLVEHMGH